MAGLCGRQVLGRVVRHQIDDDPGQPGRHQWRADQGGHGHDIARRDFGVLGAMALTRLAYAFRRMMAGVSFIRGEQSRFDASQAA
jgi:hypothetical protein